jgi:catecholate siderophore receptor
MRTTRKPLATAIFMLLSSAAAPAVASESPPSTPDPATSSGEQTSTPTTLRKVTVGAAASSDFGAAATTVGGKGSTLIRDVPQSVTVLNRAVLDAQGATTLTEALRNVPGITLSAGEGGVIGDNINLRGFSARTDLYFDGLRDRGQYSRETFFLESIEVLKGPSSMLFGRGSTGGVINQVSKQPRLRESNEIGLGIGMDAYYRGTLDMNRPLSETSALRIAALAQTSESTRDVVESERYGIAPSLRFGIGTPTQVNLSWVHQTRRDLPDYGVPFGPAGTRDNPARPIDTDRDNFFGFTDDKFDQDVDIVSARVEHQFQSGLRLRNQTQFSLARVDAQPTTIAGPADATARTGLRNRRERQIDDQSLFNQTDLIVEFKTGGIGHTITTGFEVGREDFENQTFNNTVSLTAGADNPLAQNFDNPVYGPLPDAVVRTRNAFTDSTADTLAVYVNDQLDLTPQWKVVAGVRFDRYDFETQVTNSLSGAITSALAQTDRLTSLRAGLLYQPTDWQSYYVSYGTSFNPSAETLTLTAANNNVDPEKNRSLELGGKWDLAGGELLLTSAIFRVQKSNARTLDQLTQVVTLDGETRVDGFEIGVSGRISSKVQLLAGYTYLDGEIESLNESVTVGNVATAVARDGNTLPNTARDSASLSATYSFMPNWQIGGGLVYSSERLLNNTNTSVVEGYTRYDATLAYDARNYSLRVNLQNLTDEEYFEVASAGRATPATGRTALATLTWRF